MLHFFCVNPTAGNVDFNEYSEKIAKACQAKGLDYEIVRSEYKGHITELARTAADNNKEITIYSVGGDGTINETVNGLMASKNGDAILVPVPCGSGNDFIRTFGYNEKEQIDAVIERALDTTVKEIDVMKINDVYGANISSVGFDAKVVMNSIKFKKVKIIPNKMSYTFSVFYTFVTQGAYDVKMTADGKELPYGKILLTAAANGQYYGGGMQPVPTAVIDDGLLDLCVVEKVSKLAIPKFFPKYSKGEADKIKQAHFLKCKEFVISSDKDLPLNIDGEVSFVKRAVFGISERKLKIGILSLDERK
jgi:YegS/Rv2252/BmrU family lipid kinase